MLFQARFHGAWFTCLTYTLIACLNSLLTKMFTTASLSDILLMMKHNLGMIASLLAKTSYLQ